MINPKAKLWKWGPIDGHALYTDSFIDMMCVTKEIYGVSWSDVFLSFRDGRMLVVCEYDALYDHGKKLFWQFILDDKEREKYYGIWKQNTDRAMDYIQSMSYQKITKLSDRDFRENVRKIQAFYDEFWAYVLLPEIANFGGERMLKEAIEEKHPEDSLEIIEALSTPEDLSFYQTEELALCRVKLMEEQEKALEEHARKFYWILTSYGEAKSVDADFFKEQLDRMSLDEAQKKIKEIESYVAEVKKRKRDIIKKYAIDAETARVGQLLSFCIWWQDYRKMFAFIIMNKIDDFARELSRRHHVNYEDILAYSREQFLTLAEKGKPVANIDEQKECFVSIYYDHDTSREKLVGKRGIEFIQQYSEEEVDPIVTEIKGTPVSKGKAKGVVRLLERAQQADEMQEGEILVTSMTSPEFIVAMRKSSAIITDEGGLTSHAAIVSRELKKPCIVGTRIATKVLKNGDIVQVDAKKGTVTRL